MGVNFRVGMLNHGKFPPDIRGEELGRKVRFVSQHREMNSWCHAQSSLKGRSARGGLDSHRC